MHKFLDMHSFDKNERVPTAEKIIRDGMNMYDYARYVIVLDDEGNVSEEIDREENFVGDYLVVLAPTIFKKQKIEKSVVLEIGISRSTPYKPFEKKILGEDVSIINRIRVASLKDESLLKLMPTISKILETIVASRVATWKNIDFFIPKAGRYKRRGIFLTIHNDEKILCFANHLMDMTSRNYLKVSRAAGLSRWTKGFHNKAFSYKQLCSFTRPIKIWEMLRNCNYPEHYLDYVLNQLTANQREVVADVLRAFSVREMRNKKGDNEEKLRVMQLNIKDILKTTPPPDGFKELQKLYGGKEKEIIKSWPLHIVCHPNRDVKRGENGLGSAHAEKSLRVELVPSKELVKYFKEKLSQPDVNEIPFEDTCKTIPNDNDIPF